MNNDIRSSLNPHLPEQAILYEDNHLIIVNKKPSEIVQGDKTGDKPLMDNIKDFIKVRDKKPGNVFLGVVHRIDRPVSGVVIFAKTSKALSRLNELIRNREIRKTYWAVVKNKPPEEQGHLIHYLLKNEKKNKSYPVSRDKPGALKAELNYQLISRSKDYYLLEIELITGRHHQIRAQLAAKNCPVKGDIKYRYPRTNPDASIHLHARRVEFLHPIKKETLKITAPAPTDTIWNYFERSVK